MFSTRITVLLISTALACMAHDAAAQTLYKLIDKDGKVTYAEKPPKDFPGKVIRLDIDPNANTATLPKPTAPAARVDPPKDPMAKATPAENVEAARAKLENARKALANASENPNDGDVTFIGNKGGGTRPVPSEGYARRLVALEQAVRDAEDELRKAEQNR